MSIFNVGRVCVKLAGRDAGKKCVVVEQIDARFVMVDGETRRKKVSTKHLEPLTQTVEIKEKASHDDVKKVFDKLGLKVWETKAKKTTERPKKQKLKKEKPVKKAAKKTEEKATVKKEEKKEVKESKPEEKEVSQEEVKVEEAIEA